MTDQPSPSPTPAPAPAKDRADRALTELAILPGADTDIAAAALGLARLERPSLDLAPYFELIDEMAEACRGWTRQAESAGASPDLAPVITEVYGFRGDEETYDDEANADLARVIERRRGLPVALGILWIAMARAVGWAAEGLDIPNHFLVRLAGGGRARMLDPFRGGRVIGPDGLRALLLGLGSVASLDEEPRGVSDRSVLLRLQNNTKIRRLQAGDIDGGLRTLATMRRLAPDRADLVHEEAAILARIGAVRRAGDVLTGFLEAGHGAAGDRRELERFLKTVRSTLN